MSQSENGKHENTENTQIPGIFARSTHSKWIKSSLAHAHGGREGRAAGEGAKFFDVVLD